MTAILKLLICVLLMSVSYLSSATPQYKYLRYDSSRTDDPYVYGNFENSWNTKRIIQSGDLLVLAGRDADEFKRVFDYFNQFDGGLDINWISEDEYESSYLTTATVLKNWEIVPYLIERGINLDHQDGENKATGLMYAAYCGHLPTVGRLVLARADMFLVSDHGTAMDAAKMGQERNKCPEGDYEAVIDYLTNAMEIEDSERVKKETSPVLNTKPAKYAAIAYKKDNPFIRTIVLDTRSSSGFEAIKNCNEISEKLSLRGEECEVAAVFGAGHCGAYALSEDRDHWGVGTNEEVSLAEQEALEMCLAKSEGIGCNIEISDCQSE